MMTSGNYWFAFKAENRQTVYGYGTEKEAEQYTDHLNRNNNINLYYPKRITDPYRIRQLESGQFHQVNLDDELAAIKGIR